MTLLRWLLIGMAATGCAVAPEGEPTEPPVPCDGKCDDANAAPVVSCFINADPQPDPFYRADSLICSYSEAGARGVPLASVSVEVQTASGNFHSDRRTGSGGFVLPKLRSDDYPALLDVTFRFGSSTVPGLTSLEFHSVSQQLTIESAAHFAPEHHRSFALPFDLWTVDLSSRHLDTAVLFLSHTIETTPQLTISDSVSLVSGAQVRAVVPVPRGAASVPVTIHGTSTTTGQLTGSGAYEIDAQGQLVAAAPPAANRGNVVALCTRARQQIGTSLSTEVTCSPTSFDDAVAVTAEVTSESGETITLTLDATRTASLAGDVAATVDLHATVLDTVEDLEGVANRTFTTRASLTSSSPDAEARLPFDLERTEWRVDPGMLAIVQLPALTLDLGQHQPAAVQLEQRTRSADAGTSTVIYVVRPVGQALAAIGTVAPFSGPVLRDIPLTIDRSAAWRVTATGFEQVP